jgi:hypothetical protein
MYYPKSQIQENLYSNGELAYVSNNEIYFGYYYRLSTGKFFTGKTPQDGPNEELIIIEEGAPTSSTIFDTYDDFFDKTPKYYPNTPVESDYNFGSFMRYFCKKANELIYIEISKKTFDKLSDRDPKIYWELYIPFQINWKLTGSKEDVFKVNRNIVEIAVNKNKLYQFDGYLKKDYLKFWK